jgi:hypothetical protein
MRPHAPGLAARDRDDVQAFVIAVQVTNTSAEQYNDNGCNSGRRDDRDETRELADGSPLAATGAATVGRASAGGRVGVMWWIVYTFLVTGNGKCCSHPRLSIAYVARARATS